MSSRLRYALARQPFDEFPTLARDLGPVPTVETPQAFARTLLASGTPLAAATFVAYLLARREAVWWACRSAVSISASLKDDPCLRAAEDWVRNPNEETRRAALDLGGEGDLRFVGPWLALAAGRSGGDIAPRGAPPVPAAPHMSAVCVKAGMVLTLASLPFGQLRQWEEACVEAALRFVDGEELAVIAPNFSKNSNEPDQGPDTRRSRVAR